VGEVDSLVSRTFPAMTLLGMGFFGLVVGGVFLSVYVEDVVW